MANTYKALSTVTVGAGGAASISFTNIPQTYTDLVVKLSPKTTRTDADYEGILCSINSNTTDASYYRQVVMNNSGSAVAGAGADRYVGWTATNSGTAANVFGNFDIYFPNYASSTTKVYASDFVNEGNFSAVTAQGLFSNSFSTSAAITSITFTTVSANNFTQYTTATLYGVFNADVSTAASAPTIGTATAIGNNRATVAFTGVSNAASYTATSTPDSLTGTGTTSPLIVSGLTPSTSYTFKVKANNPFGSSSESAASNSITADAGAYDSIATVTSPSSYVVEFSNIPQYYKHLQIRVSGNTTRTGYPIDDAFVRFNNDSTNNYSSVRVTGANGGGLSGLNYYTSLANNYIYGDYNMANDYANTTGTTIIDIPNYTSYKPKSVWITFGMTADTNGGRITFLSGNWRQNDPINNIRFGSANIISFAAGTKVALYGIAG